MMLLPDLALTPLRSIDEAGMKHTAELWTEISTRQPGGYYTTTQAYGPAVPARYNPLALDSPQRADMPASAHKGVLSLVSGTQIAAGQQWRVSGTTNGEAWTKAVHVDEVLGPARSSELRRRALVTDVAGN